MRRSLRALAYKIELIAIWVVRILFAPGHFGVNVFKRIRYAVFGGFMPDQVAMYSLDRRRKKEYLSEFDWHRSRRINEPYSAMLNNKLVFAELVSRYCPTPEVYAVKQHGSVRGLHGRDIRGCRDLLPLLNELGAFVVKPVCAGKGNDVSIVFAAEEGIVVNGKASDGETLIKKLEKSKEWLVCAYAHQAAYLKEIYPGSANTIRLITLYDAEKGTAEPAYAVQRLGASWTGAVDNGSKGGLIAKVDMETGILSEARSLHSLEVWERHPDTNAPIKGTVIPDWQAIRDGVTAVANELPYLDFIAWDILPTADGFTVIEANTSSGVNILQVFSPERNGRLGTFYREHGVIK